MDAPITTTHLLLLHLFSLSTQPCLKPDEIYERERDHNRRYSEFRELEGSKDMKTLTGIQNPGSDSDGAEQVHEQRVVFPNQLITQEDTINRKDPW